MTDAGRYKIFLGMAAGVGKTFRMLQEGRAAADDGVDVAVGLLETHGRLETIRAAEGLELLPRRRLEYRGVALEEMDLPHILARSPELCLIDELAHTNVPGVEHAKRFEDIADVLAAGIDVYSTMNVQHLESLNDAVHELTGVRVRETVPDDVLAAADEVVLIDLTPEALVQRLRAGKVYPAERVGAALNGFFTVENLHALRETALREVAEDVEARRLLGDVDALSRREETLFGTPPEPRAISEHLLALVGLDEADERIIRRAWRSAQRLDGELDILVVLPPGAEPCAAQRERLEALRRLASVLGAQLHVEEAEDPAEAARRVALQRGITYVLLGAPKHRRAFGRLSEPLPMRLLRVLDGVDVRVIADHRPPGVA